MTNITNEQRAIASLRDLLSWATSSARYQSTNPYMIPAIKRSMKTLADIEGIKDYLGDSTRVFYSEGCHLFKEKVQNLGIENDRISEARAVCDMSDVVIACFGLDPSLEGEEGDQGNEFASGDKSSLNLPGIQAEVIKELYKSGKPVILNQIVACLIN